MGYVFQKIILCNHRFFMIIPLFFRSDSFRNPDSVSITFLFPFPCCKPLLKVSHGKGILKSSVSASDRLPTYANRRTLPGIPPDKVRLFDILNLWKWTELSRCAVQSIPVIIITSIPFPQIFGTGCH